MKRILTVAFLLILLPVAAFCQSYTLETKFISTDAADALETLRGDCWLCVKDGNGRIFYQTGFNVAGGPVVLPFNIPPAGISGVWVQCPDKEGKMLTDWLPGDFTYHRRVTLAAYQLTNYFCSVGFAGTPYFLFFIPVGEPSIGLS